MSAGDLHHFTHSTFSQEPSQRIVIVHLHFTVGIILCFNDFFCNELSVITLKLGKMFPFPSTFPFPLFCDQCLSSEVHSTTTLTNIYTILTTYHLLGNIFGHFKYYLAFVYLTKCGLSTDHLSFLTYLVTERPKIQTMWAPWSQGFNANWSSIIEKYLKCFRCLIFHCACLVMMLVKRQAKKYSKSKDQLWPGDDGLIFKSSNQATQTS